MRQDTQKKLSHFDSSGHAHMVDVGDKPVSKRRAVASGIISMLPATLQLIRQGDAKKGDVLGVARIAAIQASKKTADLIPLCHPIALTKVAVSLDQTQPFSARSLQSRAAFLLLQSFPLPAVRLALCGYFHAGLFFLNQFR